MLPLGKHASHITSLRRVPSLQGNWLPSGKIICCDFGLSRTHYSCSGYISRWSTQSPKAWTSWCQKSSLLFWRCKQENFVNLCYHQKGFILAAEWNFFATSHGKSACDGAGGTVKRLAARASLQRPYKAHVLTPHVPGQKKNIKGIFELWAPERSVEERKAELSARFE